MKPAGDVLKDVTYDTVDFCDGCDALIDDKIIGGGDQLIAGIPITNVVPLTCPESERQFKGADLGPTPACKAPHFLNQIELINQI